MCKLIVQTVQGLHISNDMLQEVHAEFENVDIGELKYVHPEPMHQLAAEGKHRPPFLNGWVMAVQCLLHLWETLHQHYSLRFLFTNRLNQAALRICSLSSTPRWVNGTIPMQVIFAQLLLR